jgi:hypothetical protein
VLRLKLTKDFFGIETEFTGVDAEKSTGVGEAWKFVIVAGFKAPDDV